MKKITLIFLLLICVFGCGKKESLPQDIIDKQNIIKKNIEVTKDNYYVLNKDNEYYLYYVTNDKYKCLYYVLHKSEHDFNDYKNKYRGDINYNLNYDDEAYLTIITVDEGIVSEDFINTINKKHKNFKLIN